MALPSVNITGKTLTIADVVNVAHGRATVAPLGAETRQAMEATQRWLADEIQKQGTLFYGINTGFGSHANQAIDADQAGRLSRNVVLSDVAAVGDALPREIVKAMMLIRANSIAGGPSGIRPVVVDTLIRMINKNVIPFVPHKGSLGASGDLALLAAIAAVVSCDIGGGGYSGRAWYAGELMTGEAAMARAGIPRLELIAKEGNALINGTSFMTAAGCLMIDRCDQLIQHAEIAAALSFEALQAVSAAFHPAIHAASNQIGQAATAANIRKLLHGSRLIDATERVQDAYSIRCTPQIVGPVRDTVAFARGYIERTLNASIDNPLIFEDDGKQPFICVSGGAFHGEGLAFMMDFLSIAVAELASLSERRTFKLLDPNLNHGLPSMLIPSNGLNTGLMVAQYAQAALVSDNKTLAHPDSVDSIPTSANQEDHVSMGANGARHLMEIVKNVTYVIGIELMCAAQAIDLRENGVARMGKATRRAYQIIREHVDFIDGDKQMTPDFEKIGALIAAGDLLARQDELAEK